MLKSKNEVADVETENKTQRKSAAQSVSGSEIDM